MFTSIAILANRDTKTAKWVGGVGVTFGLTAVICGIIYRTYVSQENHEIISNLYNFFFKIILL